MNPTNFATDLALLCLPDLSFEHHQNNPWCRGLRHVTDPSKSKRVPREKKTIEKKADYRNYLARSRLRARVRCRSAGRGSSYTPTRRRVASVKPWRAAVATRCPWSAGTWATWATASPTTCPSARITAAHPLIPTLATVSQILCFSCFSLRVYYANTYLEFSKLIRGLGIVREFECFDVL